MRARERTERTTGRILTPACALVLLLALVAGVTAAGGIGTSPKHLPRGVAVAAVNTSDAQHVLDTPVALPGAATAAPSGPVARHLPNSSTSVSSRTAQAPLIRGPPGQAAA